jgi:hypothetical protein
LTHGSDAAPQRLAQAKVLEALNQKYGWHLQAEQRVDLGNGYFITVDGLDRDEEIAVEVNAHIGKRSASRDHKIVQDAARLQLVRHALGKSYRLVIAVCDARFHGSYAPNSRKWHARYLATMKVGVELVEIEPDMTARILEAQRTQASAHQWPSNPKSPNS